MDSKQDSNNESLPKGLVAMMICAFIVFAIVLGFTLYNDSLESKYNEQHTYVECFRTGGYVCTQDWFGGCARYEPQTKCQRYRKSGSPTFFEWKAARDR